MNAKASSSRNVGQGAAAAAAAWNLDEADDPADWNESFRFLRDLDATLRCDLCYNIFTAPVAVKDCNHIFCSVCVRNAINQPDPHGKHCPKCMRKDVYDSSLISQPLVERSAEAWKVARRALVEKQKEETVRKEQSLLSHSSPPQEAGAHRSAKRRRSEEFNDTSLSAANVDLPRRSARSASIRAGGGGATGKKQTVDEDSIVIDSDGEEEDVPEESSSGSSYNKANDSRKRINGGGGGGLSNQKQDKDYRSLEASDLAECPLCGRQVTLIVLNQHLDKGCQSTSSPSTASTTTINAASSKWFQRGGKNSVVNENNRRPRSKLARPNYSVMKEIDIKKLLKESDLPKTGSRDRLTERHRQWVTLYNANLDASEKVQKSDSQLRRDLDEWERGQEESQRKPKALNEEASRAYTISNGDHFRQLLETARESHVKNKAAHQKSTPTAANGQGEHTQITNSSPLAEATTESPIE